MRNASTSGGGCVPSGPLQFLSLPMSKSNLRPWSVHTCSSPCSWTSPVAPNSVKSSAEHYKGMNSFNKSCWVHAGWIMDLWCLTSCLNVPSLPLALHGCSLDSWSYLFTYTSLLCFCLLISFIWLACPPCCWPNLTNAHLLINRHISSCETSNLHQFGAIKSTLHHITFALNYIVRLVMDSFAFSFFPKTWKSINQNQLTLSTSVMVVVTDIASSRDKTGTTEV